jgi:hypothetical protein
VPADESIPIQSWDSQSDVLKFETPGIDKNLKVLKESKYQMEIIARSNKNPRGGHDPDMAMRLLKPPANVSKFQYGGTTRFVVFELQSFKKHYEDYTPEEKTAAL